MVQLFVRMRGPINSRKLWKELEIFDINLTDMEDEVLIYGELPLVSASVVISICQDYGEILEHKITKV